MKSLLRTTLVTVSVTLLALPLLTFAERPNVPMSQTSNLSGCPTRAFGHLIAPGFLGKHTMSFNAEDLTNCFLPPGIRKKLNLGTTTPGTISPVISDIHTTVGTTTATVFWNTNIPSDSLVFLSTTNPVSTTSSMSFGVGALVTSHMVQINNLNASTTYYAIVRSTDAHGQMSFSNQFTFTTLGPTVPNLTMTIPNMTVGTSTAVVTWTTNLPATSIVFFGTTNPLNLSASSTMSASSSALVTNHMVTITDLIPATSYQAVIQSQSGTQTVMTTPTGFTTGM